MQRCSVMCDYRRSVSAFIVAAGVMVGLLASSRGAAAATVSWSPTATTTAWTLGSNWVTGTAPVAGDDVVIFGGGNAPENNAGFGSTTINSLTLRPNPTSGVDVSVTVSNTLNVGAGGVTNLMTTGGRSLFLNGGATLAADQTWGGTRTIFVSGAVTGSKMTFNGSAIRFDVNSPSWAGGIDVRMPVLAGGGFATGTVTPFGTGTLTLINQRSDGVTASTPGFGLAGASANVSLATAQILPNAILLQDPTTGNFTIDQNNNAQPVGSGTSHFYVLAGNIAGSVNAARTLSFTNTGFSQGGAATFVLTGANTYAAGTTISDTTVTLMVGSGGTAGTLGTGTVSNAGTLQFNRSDALTVANVLTGTGQFQQIGSGTTTFTGANTHTGLTTILSGGLQIGNGGSAGTLGTGAVSNAGTLLFNRSDALTVSNTISGAGAIQQVGTGTTTLTGVNTSTGLTTITAGGLQIGNGGAAGSLGTGAVSNGGTLLFNRSNAITVSNTISGTGSIRQVGTGVLTLSGSNSFSGGTTFSGSTLVVASANALGTGSVTGTNSGILAFDLPSNGTVPNNILLSGEGAGIVNRSTTVVVTLSGTITPSASNFFTFSGQGASQAGFVLSGSTWSPNTRLIVKDTNLTIANSDAVTAANTFGNRISLGDSGGSASALYVTNGVNLGVTAVDAHNNDISAPLAMTLGMNTAGSGTFSGAFGGTAVDLHRRGTGGTSINWNFAAAAGATVNITGQVVNTGGNFQAPVTKTGPGTVIYSGSNTYGGPTAVNAGTLLVNGQLTASAVTVNSGGTLGGSGSVLSSVSVGSGGVLSPGTSPGLLSVGSLSLAAGSVTLMEINGESRGSLYDAINVASGLTYGGTLQLSFGSAFADNTTFNLFDLASGTPLGGLSNITATGNYGSLTFTNNSGVWSSGSTAIAGQTMTFTESTGTLVIVPEPSAWALAGLGGAVACWIARRRR